MIAANNQDALGRGDSAQDAANASANSETKRKFANPADADLAKELEAKSLAETRLLLE